MTVSSTTNRKTYTGDAVTTSFSTSPVVFFDTSDLTVYVVVTATGVTETLTENTHYTVTGGSGAVGTVNLAGGSAPYGAPAATKKIIIVREVPATQETDFANNDTSDAEVVEDALDRLTMLAQQNNTKLVRSLRQPDEDPTDIAALPNSVDRASLYLAFDADGDPVVTAGTTSDLVATPFIETLLDDTTAAAARTTLGALSSAAGAVDSTNLASNIITAIKLATSAMGASSSLINGTLVHSRAASAETIAIKTLAGTDPSATDPVYVVFRNATVTTGDYAVVTLTAATSLTISSGSTLGFVSSVAGRLWIVGFNDAGTFRLGVINCLSTAAGAGAGRDVTGIYPLNAWGIASSTAEGGAGNADSAQVFYTGTAVTSKAYTVLGYSTWESGLGTAGTWGTAPTRTQLFGPGVPLPNTVLQTQRSVTGAVATGTTVFARDDTIPGIATDGDQYMSQAITPTSAANGIRIRTRAILANGTVTHLGIGVFQDATANALVVSVGHAVAVDRPNEVSADALILASTTSATTLRVRGGGDSAGTTTFNGAAAGRLYGGVAGSFLECQEIMA